MVKWRQRDRRRPDRRLRTLRFVSLANRALAVQVVWIEVDQPALLTLEAWIEPPSDGLCLIGPEPNVQVWRTAHAAKQLAVASTVTLRLDVQKIQRVSDDFWALDLALECHAGSAGHLRPDRRLRPRRCRWRRRVPPRPLQRSGRGGRASPA